MRKVKLGKISKVVSGSTAPKAEAFNEKEGLPFVRAGHLEALCNGEDINNLPKVKEGSGKLVAVPKHTVIFAKSGMSIMKNRIYTTTEKVYIVNHLAGVICNQQFIIPQYLKYFLLIFKPSTLIVDESYPSIRLKDIENIYIPLPDLQIQHKIVQVLDKAQSLIDKRKEQIKQCDELIQSLFYDMFGDPFVKNSVFKWCKLGEVTVVNPNKSEIEDRNFEEKVSFVPMESVGVNGEIETDQIKTIEEVYKGFTYFKEGDVLFAKITPCMENGKGAIAKNLYNGIGFGSTEFHVLRPIENVSTSPWIFYLTKLKKFRKMAEMKMTGSAGQKRVPVSFLKEVNISVPPIELQNQFSEKVQKIEHQKQLLQQSLTLLEDNFNSLMQKAFKGELFQ